MSAHQPHDEGDDMQDEEADEYLNPDEIGEEIPDDEDMPMDFDDDDGILEEFALQNDSVAHFDAHKDSIFCIAQHPTNPALVATGGGDDVGYIWDSTPPQGPVLPASYESDPQPVERKSLEPVAKLENHTDSINAIIFTVPAGEFVVTGGLEGRVNAYKTPAHPQGTSVPVTASAQEVEEINWLSPCPNPEHPNTFALGANDGSVWVYTINARDGTLDVVQAFYLHQGACTAGTWSPDGKLLATVSEDASLYVWDAFGDAAAAGLTNAQGGQAVVGLTEADERFFVDGGLYSVAISPGGAIVAVGGAEGQIRIVGLPRLSIPQASVTSGAKGGGARNKAAGGKQAGGPKGGHSSAASGQAGVILASLQAQSDGIETLAFSQPPLAYLAAGSVDGSIAMFDAAHNFAVRRHIKEAHEEEAVIKVEFVHGGDKAHLLTTCGNDGVVRRWDARGGTAAANQGLAGEWKGHRGGGEGGGVLGFVQGGGGRAIVTAGDDGVSLVFAAP